MARRVDLGALAPDLRGRGRRVALLGTLTAAAAVAQAVLLAHAIAIAVAGVPDRGAVAPALAALAAVVLLRAGLAAAAEVDGGRAGRRAVAALRERVVDGALAGAATGEERPGALAATAVHGADAVGRYAGGYLPQRAVATAGPLLALAAVAAADPLSAGLLAVALPVAVVFLILVGLRAQAATDRRHAALRLLDGHLLDVLRGLPVLRAHGRERFQVEQVRRAGEGYRRGTVAVLREAFLSSFVLELVAMLGTALVAVACGIRLAGGSMAFAPAITALVLAPEVFAPLRRLGAEYHAAADAEPVLRELAAAAARPPAVPVGVPGAGSADAGRHDVVVTAVVTAAGDRERPALDGVDLVVPAGRTTVVTGPSGSGKTTLLRLLAGLRAPAAGTVACGGRDLASLDLERWRADVAWIPQHPVLLPASLADNLRMGRPATEHALRAALDAAGFGPLLAALPDGLESRLGDGGLPLSAGERRRLAVARAVLRQPRLVLVDEPTANLDRLAAEQVVDALRRLVAGRTAVIATHDPLPLALADERLRLRGGHVAPDPASASFPSLELLA
ncbi:thiol reductant ABC exporter subunit CydD [Patulibacter defluvii]|uniref:thiol reductant ABC exporter subunit CydD n=1 Tax=Patulibacter defluvii TaxID=3095358 RepID=UPI002A758364|nr:thiol reductant ABC exporter subunit CydD [Patulibacter sp. DM4]